MATHSSALAWRIPGTGEPGGLPSTGSHRVRHDRSDLAAAAYMCGGGGLWQISIPSLRFCWESKITVKSKAIKENLSVPFSSVIR